MRVLLPRLLKCLEDLDYEILVVDTKAEMDGTKSYCTGLESENIRYVNRSPDNYYGDAIRTGIANITGDLAVCMDADGSHSPEFILQMLPAAKENDLVIASRYIEGGYTENNKVQVLMSKIVNLVYSTVLGLKCKDVSNSFRIYRTNQLKTLSLRCNNFDIVEEILFKLTRNYTDLRVIELPYTFKQRLFGETKRSMIEFIYSYLRTLVKLWVNDRISRV